MRTAMVRHVAIKGDRGRFVTSPIETRFQRFIAKDGDCWLWTGGLSGRRYGVFTVNGRLVIAHRWAYEHFIGSIPEGLVLDHLCRQTLCVNPSHLEAVTQAENNHRNPLFGANKTHCPKGHRYLGANLYTRPDGRRECRACGRTRMNKKVAA